MDEDEKDMSMDSDSGGCFRAMRDTNAERACHVLVFGTASSRVLRFAWGGSEPVRPVRAHFFLSSISIPKIE